MEKKTMLNRIKSVYESGGNVICHLKEGHVLSTEDILISYDFQAGTYVDYYYKNLDFEKRHAKRIIDVIDSLEGNIESIFDAGVGEATRFIPVLNGIDRDLVFCGGADLSWSRIKTAQMFAKKELKKRNPIHLFCADMFCLPLMDESIDLVITMHALEPNGGHERELLQELYRVTNQYLLLIEPDYSLASEEGKRRMDTNGYIKDLYCISKNLGYNTILYEPFEIDTRHDVNPASIIVIKKETKHSCNEMPICDPLTKSPIQIIGDCYYSESSMLSYPILNNVPCLMRDNAIVATRMLDLYE